MEYVQDPELSAQAARRMQNVAGAQLGRGIQQARVDLPALRDQLQLCVERASVMGIRANALADNIFGPEPSGTAANVKAGVEHAPPSFAGLVDDLQSALARIESGLNRL